jgi:hypothetical protein
MEYLEEANGKRSIYSPEGRGLDTSGFKAISLIILEASLYR